MSGSHFSPFVLLAVLLGYVAVLIAIGAWAEHAARRGRDVTARGWVYALSLSVYCTSWTFFGSVGSAATSGMLYSAIYLGPTLVMVVAWGVIRRMIRLRHRYRFSSIVDLLTQRYGQSLAMGAFITLVLLLGMIPYIALQIRAILGSFTLLTGLDHHANTLWLGHFTDEMMLILIGVLTGLFGLRRVDTRVRQHGMIAVLAAESVVKLVAFVAVGVFVTYGLFDGFQDLHQRVTQDPTLTGLLNGHGDQAGFYLNWMTYLVLAMAAILFLPRMFHIMVIENHDERHLTTAMWLFPLYLLLISLFVLPIALGGLVLGYPASDADWFVIRLPFDRGPALLTLFAYLGGFSAAVGMVMVACTTMAIMFSNHIVLPIIESSRYGVHLHGRLRGIRWVVVFAMLGLAYWFQKGLGDSYLLIQMGLISFAAMLQFVPAALGALYWRRASRVGVWWGLALGWAVWAYTLFIPALVRSGWGDTVGWLGAGPLGIGFLRPDALFGLDLASPYFNAAFWSLLFNLGGYVLGSILYPPSADDEALIEGYCAVLDNSQATVAADESDVLIDLGRVRAQVGRLFERYLPPPEAELASAQALAELATTSTQTLSGRAYLSLSARVERTLAGAIGAAMARKAVVESMPLDEREMAGLAQTWTQQLAELKISPQQMREQVDYFRSLNELSARHAADMEEKIQALEQAAVEREQADAALRESELRFRSLADSAPVMVWMTASADGEDFFNRTWLAFTGRTLVDEAANGWVRGIHPDDVERALTAMATTLERHSAIEHEFRLRRHDGEYRYLRVQVVPRYSASGQFLGIIGSAIDISDLKAAEAALRRSNEDLEARVSERTAEMLRAKAWSEDIIRLAPNMVIGLDAAGDIVLFNDYAEHLTGYRRAQVLGRNWLQQFLPEDHRAALGAILDEAAATGEMLHNNEHPIVLRDGSERMVSWHSQTMLEDGKLKMVLSFGVDVTERRRAEKALKQSYADLKQLNQRLEQAQNQLLQSEKMASIGQLAAGVAHEINNPVGFVNSNFGTLKIYCEQMLGLLAAYQASEAEITDPAALQTIAELKRALDIDYLREDLPALIRESEDGLLRVKKIVQDLKDFSHVNESEWQFADLNTGLDSTLNVVWNEVKYKATVDKHYATLPEVECLAAQLNQVFMNLIVNAVHALDPAKGMGTLTLSSGQQGDEVWVEVADSGRGMSAEVQRRIFEPFYTTKPVGKGTGLGLSLSFSIIQKHQGRIEVDSVPGEGSRFRVWVPIRRSQPATATA